MTGKKPQRAAIYARISRDKKDDGATIKGQVDLCLDLAKRHGLTVAEEHIYREPDGTGASEKSKAKAREQYDAMLAAARAGEFQWILAYADDRLTRRPMELEQLIDLVDKTGLQLRTVRVENYDLSSSSGITIARIMSAMAAQEARLISERQKVTFERKAREGKPKLQRQRPFGWEQDGITIREDEAALIREAVEEIKAGATIASIRHKWNQAGIKTAVDPNSSKKEKKPTGEWEWIVLQRMLLGWRTAGIRTRHRQPLRDEKGELIRGQWEPIISLEDRAQALAALERHARKKLRTGSWPLAGLLRCGECGQPLYGQLPSGARVRSTYGCKAGHLAISAGLLEQVIIRWTIQRAYEEQNQGRSVPEAKPRQLSDWPKLDQLNSVRDQITELMDAYKSKQLSGSIVFPQVDELDQTQKELQRELDHFLAEELPLPSMLRQSAEALEWLQGVQGQFLRITPKEAKPWENQPWGSEVDLETSHQELPFAASAEETAELNQLLRGELELIVIRKGRAGRQSAATFEDRVDPVWSD